MRLLNDLTYEAPDMSIEVRDVVINQVLKEDDDIARVLLTHAESTQRTAISDLKTIVGSTNS
jgi:hypothetical protein